MRMGCIKGWHRQCLRTIGMYCEDGGKGCDVISMGSSGQTLSLTEYYTFISADSPVLNREFLYKESTLIINH